MNRFPPFVFLFWTRSAEAGAEGNWQGSANPRARPQDGLGPSPLPRETRGIVFQFLPTCSPSGGRTGLRGGLCVLAPPGGRHMTVFLCAESGHGGQDPGRQRTHLHARCRVPEAGGGDELA